MEKQNNMGTMYSLRHYKHGFVGYFFHKEEAESIMKEMGGVFEWETIPNVNLSLMGHEEKTLRERWDGLNESSKDYFFSQVRSIDDLFPPTGPFFVTRWSRDCDMCEMSSSYEIKTYEELIEDYIGYIEGLEWAEGPSSWSLVSSYEYNGEYSHTKDRVMEAYENGGNGYWV